jgi:RimJ/RimL family protein N-acetyltransferase
MKENNYFIRAIEEKDLELIQRWRNHPTTLPYVREYRIMSLPHIKKWYESIVTSDKFEMFIMQDKEIPIGVCGLTYINWQNRHADLHLAIYHNNEWVDKEYAPEFFKIITAYAFEEMNLNKLYVEVYENDSKKIDFFESLNFQKDAVLREHYFHKGRYLNSYIYSLLRRES